MTGEVVRDLDRGHVVDGGHMVTKKPGVLVFNPPERGSGRPFQPMPQPKVKPAESNPPGRIDPKAATSGAPGD